MRKRLWILSIFLAAVVSAGVIVNIRHTKSGTPPFAPKPTVPTRRVAPAQPSPYRPGLKPAAVDITLDFAGDCTFGTVNGDGGPCRFPTVYRRYMRSLTGGKGRGGVDYPFHLVRRWFDHDDLTVVNFECTLTNATAIADKQWHFKGPAQYASIFPASGVDVAGIANNHSHDYLQAGFDDTVANFKRAHVPTFYQNTPYITTIKGIEVVLIADCTVVGENTTLIDGVPARVLSQIKRYKKPGNVIIIFMHWGSELDKTPRPWQQAMGHRFIDAGADAVIGAHPHVLQGMEQYHGKYIAYSLGNFAFGGNTHARYPETVILRLESHVDAGKPGPLMAKIIPCLTTSAHSTSDSGALVNDYQPIPVTGAAADHVVNVVRERSRGLKYGLKRLMYVTR